ncbi:hypothetical protein COCOBI_08-6030 [Coccomyxa sp. Obi]|nr:hypothetical protein COCOBI_08-6030 [Coccomyxa sp. Obi]
MDACSPAAAMEWITSCGLACKHFQQLQPLRIASVWPTYGVGNAESLVRWMLHHWMDACAIDLKMLPPIEDAPSIVTRLLDSIRIGALVTRSQEHDLLQSSLGAGADSLAPAALRVFRGTFISHEMVYKAMMTSSLQGLRRARLLYISEGPLERLCACLLPLMGGLTVLNLFIPKAPQLPPFNKLEHLEIHSFDFEGVQQSLLGLHRLKTLFLSCEVLQALLPELYLTGLPNLRHVRLDDVFPAELSLPSGCRLDLMGEADVMDQVIGAAWQDALQHLHACTCTWTSSPDAGISHVQTLPSFLLMAAGCIQELTLLEVRKVQYHYPIKITIRLDPAIFYNLKKLSVRSKGLLQMHVPAAVQLVSLQVYVSTLLITFDDARVSCANLTDVNVLYISFILHPTGSALELLQGPLAH